MSISAVFIMIGFSLTTVKYSYNILYLSTP